MRKPIDLDVAIDEAVEWCSTCNKWGSFQMDFMICNMLCIFGCPTNGDKHFARTWWKKKVKLLIRIYKKVKTKYADFGMSSFYTDGFALNDGILPLCRNEMEEAI